MSDHDSVCDIITITIITAYLSCMKMTMDAWLTWEQLLKYFFLQSCLSFLTYNNIARHHHRKQIIDSKIFGCPTSFSWINIILLHIMSSSEYEFLIQEVCLPILSFVAPTFISAYVYFTCDSFDHVFMHLMSHYRIIVYKWFRSFREQRELLMNKSLIVSNGVTTQATQVEEEIPSPVHITSVIHASPRPPLSPQSSSSPSVSSVESEEKEDITYKLDVNLNHIVSIQK